MILILCQLYLLWFSSGFGSKPTDKMETPPTLDLRNIIASFTRKIFSFQFYCSKIKIYRRRKFKWQELWKITYLFYKSQSYSLIRVKLMEYMMLGFLSGNWLFLIQGTLVPKLTLGPFLTLSKILLEGYFTGFSTIAAKCR